MKNGSHWKEEVSKGNGFENRKWKGPRLAVCSHHVESANSYCKLIL